MSEGDEFMARFRSRACLPVPALSLFLSPPFCLPVGLSVCLSLAFYLSACVSLAGVAYLLRDDEMFLPNVLYEMSLFSQYFETVLFYPSPTNLSAESSHRVLNLGFVLSTAAPIVTYLGYYWII